MIDVAVTLVPARDVVAIDLWYGDLPPLSGRAIQVEPRRWWVIGGGVGNIVLGDRGAAAPIGGGLVCATLTGPGWRDLLSVSGFLDTDRLGVGNAASTVIHHVPVRIVVTGDESCEVFLAASFADTLRALWHRATKGE